MTDPYQCPICLTRHPVASLARDCETKHRTDPPPR